MLHNQPVLKFESSDDESITFEFDESCGIDSKKESHMGGLTLHFNEGGTITQEWSHFEGGKVKGKQPIKLTREKS